MGWTYSFWRIDYSTLIHKKTASAESYNILSIFSLNNAVFWRVFLYLFYGSLYLTTIFLPLRLCVLTISLFIVAFFQQSFTGKKPKLFSKTTTVNGKEQTTDYKRICNYSGKYLREESLSIWCENIELYFLGSGYPMYFDFMKSCMLVLFLIFISSGSFNIFSNAFTGTDC